MLEVGKPGSILEGLVMMALPPPDKAQKRHTKGQRTDLDAVHSILEARNAKLQHNSKLRKEWELHDKKIQSHNASVIHRDEREGREEVKRNKEKAFASIQKYNETMSAHRNVLRDRVQRTSLNNWATGEQSRAFGGIVGPDSQLQVYEEARHSREQQEVKNSLNCTQPAKRTPRISIQPATDLVKAREMVGIGRKIDGIDTRIGEMNRVVDMGEMKKNQDRALLQKREMIKSNRTSLPPSVEDANQAAVYANPYDGPSLESSLPIRNTQNRAEWNDPALIARINEREESRGVIYSSRRQDVMVVPQLIPKHDAIIPTENKEDHISSANISEARLKEREHSEAMGAITRSALMRMDERCPQSRNIPQHLIQEKTREHGLFKCTDAVHNKSQSSHCAVTHAIGGYSPLAEVIGNSISPVHSAYVEKPLPKDDTSVTGPPVQHDNSNPIPYSTHVNTGHDISLPPLIMERADTHTHDATAPLDPGKDAHASHIGGRGYWGFPEDDVPNLATPIIELAMSAPVATTQVTPKCEEEHRQCSVVLDTTNATTTQSVTPRTDDFRLCSLLDDDALSNAKTRTNSPRGTNSHMAHVSHSITTDRTANQSIYDDLGIMVSPITSM